MSREGDPGRYKERPQKEFPDTTFQKGFLGKATSGVDTESCIWQYSASPAAWLSSILFCSVPYSEDGYPPGLWDISEYLETINYPRLDMPEGPTLKHREMM